MQELSERLDQKEFLPQVLSLESLLIKAANGESYDEILHVVEQTRYAPDIDFTKLKRHLPILVDAVKQGFVKKVTTICTICDANPTFKLILSEVHKLLRL